MKTIVMIYAADAKEFAFEKKFDTKSAFERVILFASKVPEVQRIVIFTDEKSRNIYKFDSIIGDSSFISSSIPVDIVESSSWTKSSLLSQMSQKSLSYDFTVFGWYDCPFYDEELVKKLCNAHVDYIAEYTFADGYPVGVAPEIIDRGALSIISELAKENNENISRDILFSIMKKDINSFDIETVLAPCDMRQFRLSFTCDTKRNFLSCTRLYDSFNCEEILSEQGSQTSCIDQLCSFASTNPTIIRTLPAFYAIQITGLCSGACTFCPWPGLSKSLYGYLPNELNIKSSPTAFMSFSNFQKLVQEIAAFSDDAVISLSLWGDPLLHEQFLDFVHEVLSYPNLSLLIETDGIKLTESIVKSTKEMVDNLRQNTSKKKVINWVVAVDASDVNMYESLHGNKDGFEKAISAISLLKQNFPGDVYPQFIRMQENENQLESFYRKWKEDGTGELIIQKYDNLSGFLLNKKVADLTPIIRNSCWHLRRDMNILADGTVIRCKSIMATQIQNGKSVGIGNVFSENIESIWNKDQDFFVAHNEQSYTETCRNCDEYYTFNF